MRSKFKVLGLVAAVAFGAPLSGNATISIDPDGAGPNGAIVVGALDWSPTSFLGQGAVTAIQNFQSGVGPTTFDVVTSAQLGNFLAPGTNTPIGGTGLNSTYEWTMVSSFTENVVSVTFNPVTGKITADFQLVPAAGGFLELYKGAINSSPLNGSGYNDGTLILRATSVDAALGSFSVNCASFTAGGFPPCLQPNTGPVVLDQGGGNGNQYGPQTTVTGSGASDNITVSGITFDSSYFLSTPTSLSLQFANISQGLPFISPDPMACYVDDPNGALAIGAVAAGALQCAGYLQTNGANYAGQGAGTNGGYIPVTGPVNGAGFATASGLTGDDVFQTDFNSPINGVPEPASLALLGAALGAAGLIGRRRRSTVR